MIALLACLIIGCATQARSEAENEGAVLEVQIPAISRSASYDLVGYWFEYHLEGDVVTFTYMDAAAESDIPTIAKTLLGVLPMANGYEYPNPGCLVLKASRNLTEEEFNQFVKAADGLIYDNIY